MVRRQLMNWNILLCLLVLIASAGTTIKAHAHAMEQSYIFLSISDTSIDGRLEMTIEDLNNAMDLSLPLDKSVTQEQIQPHIEDIKAYFDQNISMGFRDGIKLDDLFLHSIPASQYIAINFSFKNVETIPQYIDFTYKVLFDKDSNHLGMVIIENDWRSGVFNDEANIALIFKPNDTQKRLDLTDATVMQGYWEMLKLGIHHILEGIDHVLFLIALLLPAVVVRAHREWQPAKGVLSSIYLCCKGSHCLYAGPYHHLKCRHIRRAFIAFTAGGIDHRHIHRDCSVRYSIPGV